MGDERQPLPVAHDRLELELLVGVVRAGGVCDGAGDAASDGGDDSIAAAVFGGQDYAPWRADGDSFGRAVSGAGPLRPVDGATAIN